MRKRIKKIVCRFCGKTCDFDNSNHRVYEEGTSDLHVRNCPKRATHYKEKALDSAENERQDRFGEYNRKGTENSIGRRFVEGMELLSDED